MEPFFLVQMHNQIGTPIPDGLFCSFDPEIIARDWQDGDESPIECGMSHSKHADKVVMMMPKQPEMLTTHQAEMAIQRLVYLNLSRAGFSVEWDGEVFGGIYLKPEERFFKNEDENEEANSEEE
jgi:hypothetical protein